MAEVTTIVWYLAVIAALFWLFFVVMVTQGRSFGDSWGEAIKGTATEMLEFLRIFPKVLTITVIAALPLILLIFATITPYVVDKYVR